MHCHSSPLRAAGIKAVIRAVAGGYIPATLAGRCQAENERETILAGRFPGSMPRRRVSFSKIDERAQLREVVAVFKILK